MPTRVGANWTFKNQYIQTGGNQLGLGCAVTASDGVGVIEHVYIKSTQSSDKPAIWVNPNKHRGHLIVKNVHIEGHADNAFYSENAPPHGVGGTQVIEDCYFHDNTRGNLRVNGGTEARNVHIHNTGNNFPTRGYVSAGYYSWYGGSGDIDLKHCQIDMPGTRTKHNSGAFALKVWNRSSRLPRVNVMNSQVRGSIIDSANRISLSNTGKNPQINPPAGVPMTAQEARNGTSSATGPTWEEISGGGGGGGMDIGSIVNDDGENEFTIRPK